MGLKIKTARNSMLMGGVYLVARPLNFTVAVILARLLAPSEFGLVALAMILITSSNLFTNLGMGQALIQSKDQQEKVAFHAFVIVCTSSLIFFLLILIYNVQLAQFMGDIRIAPVLSWLSGLVMLGGLSIIPMSLLRKQLMFRTIALANLISLVSYASSAIIMAYAGWGLWSMIYANLFSTALLGLLYWIWCPGWAWLTPTRWDNSQVRRLFAYGIQVCGSGLLAYFHTNWDDWLVGRMLGVTPLGFYNKSYDISNATIGKLIQNTIGTVFFPSYAKMQGNKERISRVYLKTVRIVLLFVTPIALGMVVVASPLVQVVFGAKWIPMIAVMQIFAVLILTRPVSENAAPVFQSLGYPGYNMRAGIMLLVLMVPSVLYMIRWQIEGVATAVVIAHMLAALYNIYQVNSLLPGTARATFKIAVPILFTGIAMGLAVHFSKGIVTDQFGTLNRLPALLSLIGIGAIVYLIISLILQRELMRELFQILSAILPTHWRMKHFGNRERVITP